MRSSAQVEAREISDGDLDSVSGGIGVSGGGGVGPVGVFGGVDVEGLEQLAGIAEPALPGSWAAGNVTS